MRVCIVFLEPCAMHMKVINLDACNLSIACRFSGQGTGSPGLLLISTWSLESKDVSLRNMRRKLREALYSQRCKQREYRNAYALIIKRNSCMTRLSSDMKVLYIRGIFAREVGQILSICKLVGHQRDRRLAKSCAVDMMTLINTARGTWLRRQACCMFAIRPQSSCWRDMPSW